nr:hypothetical protein Q903MT_gene2387 [Picea sitchensis]
MGANMSPSGYVLLLSMHHQLQPRCILLESNVMKILLKEGMNLL